MRLFNKTLVLLIAMSMLLNVGIARSLFAGVSPDPGPDKITFHAPKGSAVTTEDMPKSASNEDQTWFSKYKWWLLAGLVVVGGAAAGGGGGGGGGGSSTPTDSGASVSVGW